MNTFNEIIKKGQATTEEAFSLFDQLKAVDLDYMIGKWQGSGFHTNHPMDGMLEFFDWHGKEFIDADNVHPLIFADSNGYCFKVNPGLIPMKFAVNFPLPKNAITKLLFTLINPLLRTRKSKARIRMMEYRGKISATMIYDSLPILDIFRKIDEDTLLGVMDLKGSPQPFFFVLKREKDGNQ